MGLDKLPIEQINEHVSLARTQRGLPQFHDRASNGTCRDDTSNLSITS
jgi:hypothetical protein